jgi:hypothetical protein
MARSPSASEVDEFYVSSQPTPQKSNADAGSATLKNQNLGTLFFVRGRTRVSKNSMIRAQPS